MTDLTYIIGVLLSVFVGAGFGFAAHFARAHFTTYPERVTGNDWMDDAMSNNDIVFESQVVGAKWDDNGFWDADSNRNLIYYVATCAAAPVMAGIWFWSDRVQVVGAFCHTAMGLGLTPPMC